MQTKRICTRSAACHWNIDGNGQPWIDLFTFLSRDRPTRIDLNDWTHDRSIVLYDRCQSRLKIFSVFFVTQKTVRIKISRRRKKFQLIITDRQLLKKRRKQIPIRPNFHWKREKQSNYSGLEDSYWLQQFDEKYKPVSTRARQWQLKWNQWQKSNRESQMNSYKD